MPYKVDSSRSKILQATCSILLLSSIPLTLLLSTIQVADPTIENASKLTNNLNWLIGLPLYIQVLLAIELIQLSYLFALLFLLKKVKKIKKQSLGVYNSRTYSKLPPDEDIAKIIKFIIKNNIIKHSNLVNDLGYSDIKATHYLSQLSKNDIIQEAPFINHKFNDGNYTYYKDGQIKYVIGEGGRDFAIKHNLD